MHKQIKFKLYFQLKNRKEIVCFNVYTDLFLFFLFWLEEGDVQDQLLGLINITFELGLWFCDCYSFLQNNLHQMLQFYDDSQKQQVMHSEKPD